VDGTTFLNAYLALLDGIPAGIPVVCVVRGFQFIDGSALVPHDRLYYSEPATSVALHPNDLGHMLMAANLRAQLTAIGWLP
jgi:hypothetical protein